MHFPGITALTMSHILICPVFSGPLKIQKNPCCLFCFVLNAVGDINFIYLIYFLISNPHTFVTGLKMPYIMKHLALMP